MKTWKGKMIKHILKIREESGTYLSRVCRHRWCRQITMKVDVLGAVELMKAAVLAESNFHRDLSAPAMSTDMSQVGVALFPSF